MKSGLIREATCHEDADASGCSLAVSDVHVPVHPPLESLQSCQEGRSNLYFRDEDGGAQSHQLARLCPHLSWD